MSRDLKDSPNGHLHDASPEGAYILKVVLTTAEVIDRLKEHSDSEHSLSALDPKKPFYGRIGVPTHLGSPPYLFASRVLMAGWREGERHPSRE